MKKIITFLMCAGILIIILSSCNRKIYSGTSRDFDTVNVGTTANDGTGDPIRTAFLKLNVFVKHANTIGWDNLSAADINFLLHLGDSLNIHLDVNDTTSMLGNYARNGEVMQMIADSLAARLAAATEGVSLAEYDNYTGNDDFVDLLQSMGADIVALPYMRNTRMFPADFAMADGRAYYCVIQVRDTTVFTGVRFVLATAGVYTADNFNGVALYSVSGTTYTQVAVSADDGNIWKTTALSVGTKAFTSPYTAVPGIYYFAMVYNSSAQTTAPSIYACDPWASANFLLSTGNKIAGYVGAQTTLPATETAGDVTHYTNTPSIWFY
jgi:hypothetical protein